ncbi:hypothetical protein NQ317_012139 [Molorchus minor]|uniref:Uncharacterized protein n=1 Tax=Molorchus minor TaxID=1323400 RepID=A0ABQ9IQJ1_9CUCU|nr:hypothetical protein NQ317_012139 [Molorchus minor]
MDKIATENLFLLEFLVDKVELNQKCQCDAPPSETCVSFQFLDNAPLDVCEADFTPKRNYREDTDTTTKSGKSCLFSLSPDQADICLDTFDINVTIWRKMLPGWLPEKVEIGQALISIGKYTGSLSTVAGGHVLTFFGELITCVESSDGSVPTAKTLKDDFEITNDRGDSQGKITIYIRMSCFGKLIITQFQMNLDEKSVLFKDKEGKSLYRYKKAGKVET